MREPFVSLSQHGEDLLVAERFSGKREGFFVEVGALDGETFSNTAMLERELGWTGVLIEADPVQAMACEKNRPGSVTVAKAVTSPAMAGRTLQLQVVEGFNALSTLEANRHTTEIISRKNSDEQRPAHLTMRTRTVESATLDAVLASSGTPKEFRFLSIDIEGHERIALEGLSLGSVWKPEVILIENNHVLQDLAVSRLLRSAGYGYVTTVAGINDWYEQTTPSGAKLGLIRQCAAAGVPSARWYASRVLRWLGLLSAARRFRSRLKHGGVNGVRQMRKKTPSA